MNETEAQLGSIEHLDFDSKEEKEPEKRHWGHPTDPRLWWCGEAKKSVYPYSAHEKGSLESREVTCAGCLHEYISHRGGGWWWRVHRAWYGSTCTPDSDHDCRS